MAGTEAVLHIKRVKAIRTDEAEKRVEFLVTPSDMPTDITLSFAEPDIRNVLPSLVSALRTSKDDRAFTVAKGAEITATENLDEFLFSFVDAEIGSSVPTQLTRHALERLRRAIDELLDYKSSRPSETH